MISQRVLELFSASLFKPPSAQDAKFKNDKPNFSTTLSLNSKMNTCFWSKWKILTHRRVMMILLTPAGLVGPVTFGYFETWQRIKRDSELNEQKFEETINALETKLEQYDWTSRDGKWCLSEFHIPLCTSHHRWKLQSNTIKFAIYG